ncbi:MAG TPA: patatin family protein [Clostridiaceae bacterium]|nr:patatin family protein [Clostridiaceae bacterium]
MLGVIDVGGGLRGIYGGAIFDYCLENDIQFDHCIGVSAGCANIATFLAGQHGRTYTFYKTYSKRKAYMSVYNWLFKKNYVDLDYIYSTLSNSDGENPLDYIALKENPASFEIVTTDAITGKPHYFDKTSLRFDEYDVIKASCAIPVVCQPYVINGHPYYDGGLSDPIPLKRALKAGCEKVVVILTRPRNFYRERSKKTDFLAKFSRKYAGGMQAWADRSIIYNQQLDYAKKMEKQGSALIIAPDSIGDLKTLTKDEDMLDKLYAAGRTDAAAIIDYFQ